MDHLTDRQLELWLGSKDKITPEEADSISEHIELCRFCKQRLNTLKAYYSDLEKELSQSPGKKERAIASKIFQRRNIKVLPSVSLIQTYKAPLEEHRSSLPVRVKNYLHQYPVSSASITLGTFFLAALFFVIQPWQTLNMNPIYAEVEKNVLHVYNQEGESIWRMVVEGILNNTNSEMGADRPSKRFMRITDIDGDGINEVLLTGDDYNGDFSADILYCYNNDGSLRWKQTTPPPISFGERTHSRVINWDILDFFVYDPSDGTPQLFVTSNSSWFPSVLFELDVLNGEILQSYWHPGWIWDVEVYKNINSENDQLIIGATNNAYQKAALIILNPDKISGHSPLKESYQPAEVTRASETKYIMFKPSKLNELMGFQLYNEISRIRISDDGGLIIQTIEHLQEPNDPVSILYTLNKNFKVLEARGVAKYQKLYSDMYNEGKLEQPLTGEYWEALKDSVLYWNETTISFISHRQTQD